MTYIEAIEKALKIKANLKMLPMQPGEVLSTYANTDALYDYIGFKPKTRVYVFFDGVAVSQFCTPTSSAFSSVDSPVSGSPLITDSSGAISGTFAIPEHRFPGQENNPRFRTGEVAFRLSSSETNVLKPAPKTQGNAVYQDLDDGVA